MIILTDIHGNFDTMLALLEMIPEEEKAKGIAICGDLVDRGPKSMQVIQWAIDNNIPVVLGNHENMMLDWFQNGCNYSDDLWLLNGGDFALDSYREFEEGEYLKGEVQWDIFKKHCEWISSLPYYLEFPNLKKDGRYLVLSHSNINNVWHHRDSEQAKNVMTWGRLYGNLKEVPEIYNVIGHTPQRYGARARNIYCNIDTGCFYTQESGYGKLTALQFPEMIFYEHENIDKAPKDNPVKSILTLEELNSRKK